MISLFFCISYSPCFKLWYVGYFWNIVYFSVFFHWQSDGKIFHLTQRNGCYVVGIEDNLPYIDWNTRGGVCYRRERCFNSCDCVLSGNGKREAWTGQVCCRCSCRSGSSVYQKTELSFRSEGTAAGCSCQICICFRDFYERIALSIQRAAYVERRVLLEGL